MGSTASVRERPYFEDGLKPGAPAKKKRWLSGRDSNPYSDRVVND